MLSHESLQNLILTNFAMRQHHGWTLDELENVLPWERRIYVDLLNDYLERVEDANH